MDPILHESRDGRILRLALNRPHKRNALNLELCRALTSALDQANQDPAIGAILLTGNGPSFCSGLDIEEALADDPQEQAEALAQLFSFYRRATKPLIAAVQGAVIGGGVGLAANAHVVIAAQGSTFAVTGVRIGAWPFVLFRALAHAIGERRAFELSLTGRAWNPMEALQAGLIHQIAPQFEFDDRADAYARHLADASPQAMRSGFEWVARTRDLPDQEAEELARQFHAESLRGRDFAEGIAALREGRPAVWPSMKTPDPRAEDQQ